MAYFKYLASQLFDGYRFREPGTVLITDENGVVQDLLPEQDAGEGIVRLPVILSPGLINCHCHLELSHLRGQIPEHTGLVDFLISVVKLRQFPEEEILKAIEAGEDEMLHNGIVAVGDISNNSSTVAQKQKARLFYRNFIESLGFNPAFAEKRFTHSAETYTAFAKLYAFPAGSCSIVPHAPYSVSAPLWQSILHFPGNSLLTMHNQETEAENEWFLSKTGDMARLYETLNTANTSFEASGNTSLQTCLPYFLPNQKIILVHNVCTSAADLEFAAQFKDRNEIFWCLCPNANRYISNTLPDIPLLMRNEDHIVLGTDSLSSNHQLNIISEIKTIQQAYPQISTETLLRWATSNGARALELDQWLGSFEKGKQPGLIVIDFTKEENEVMRIV